MSHIHGLLVIRSETVDLKNLGLRSDYLTSDARWDIDENLEADALWCQTELTKTVLINSRVVELTCFDKLPFTWSYSGKLLGKHFATVPTFCPPVNILS